MSSGIDVHSNSLNKYTTRFSFASAYEKIRSEFFVLRTRVHARSTKTPTHLHISRHTICNCLLVDFLNVDNCVQTFVAIVKFSLPFNGRLYVCYFMPSYLIGKSYFLLISNIYLISSYKYSYSGILY